MASVQRVECKARAADGRALSVLAVGPPEGDPVFFLHGTPGVLGMYGENIEEGFQRGLRHVFYARPGYAGSDRQPGRTIADCAGDISAVADELGIGRFYAVGESGGGPHALAAAALLPDRVRAVAVLAGVAPSTVEGLDWEEGMGEGNRREFDAMDKGVGALQEHLESEARQLSSVETRAELLALLDEHLCDDDRAAIDESLGDYLLAAWRLIGKDEIWGWLDDDLAQARDWGFALSQVTAPVTVWQGREDLMVPFAHAEWLTAHLPNAKLYLLPGVGHVSLLSRYGAILDTLIALDP